VQEDFPQLKLLVRSWLQGAGMHAALKAVNMGLEWHTGFRKDGVTPEYTHQLSQIFQIRSLKRIIDLEAVIVTIALHDLPEDKRFDIKMIGHEFGPERLQSVECMSKKFYEKDANKSSEQYYYALGLDRDASIAKGQDRVHNQASMTNVLGSFGLQRTIAFIDKMITETETYVLPMLKQARKNFPEQEPAYTAFRHRLKEQIHITKSAIEIGRLAGSHNLMPVTKAV
jgi:(p)ppGpp synthase/HD superfamily hydrolase